MRRLLSQLLVGGVGDNSYMAGQASKDVKSMPAEMRKRQLEKLVSNKAGDQPQ